MHRLCGKDSEFLIPGSTSFKQPWKGILLRSASVSSRCPLLCPILRVPWRLEEMSSVHTLLTAVSLQKWVIVILCFGRCLPFCLPSARMSLTKDFSSLTHQLQASRHIPWGCHEASSLCSQLQPPDTGSKSLRGEKSKAEACLETRSFRLWGNECTSHAVLITTHGF